DGVSLPDAVGKYGVSLDTALEARSQLQNAGAYLELHIEQGPVLESMELPLGVVLGTFGVERSRITWRGQAAHAGSTPMDKRRVAQEEYVDVEWERIWSIEPILFDETLIGFADDAIGEVAGTSHRLPSGPLHDAAEVARAGVPTVMLFVQSLRGLSHTKVEDTKPEHLELSVEALDKLAAKTVAGLAAA